MTNLQGLEENVETEKSGGIVALTDSQIEQIQSTFLKGMAHYFVMSREKQKQCIYLPLLLLRGYHKLKEYKNT
jgi:hypothetical protein